MHQPRLRLLSLTCWQVQAMWADDWRLNRKRVMGERLPVDVQSGTSPEWALNLTALGL
jgi:hypothetical protein